jgi:hypothetical protein
VYGEQDRMLTDVADTFARLVKDLPTATVTALWNRAWTWISGCGATSRSAHHASSRRRGRMRVFRS